MCLTRYIKQLHNDIIIILFYKQYYNNELNNFGGGSYPFLL